MNAAKTRPAVTESDVIRFLENAFRNIELPPLGRDDVADIRRGLQDIRNSVAAATVDRAERPFLEERRFDADCKCLEEVWTAFGANLHLHLAAGTPSNGHADYGDEGSAEITVTAPTPDLARAAIFGWAREIERPGSMLGSWQPLQLDVAMSSREQAKLQLSLNEAVLAAETSKPAWRKLLMERILDILGVPALINGLAS